MKEIIPFEFSMEQEMSEMSKKEFEDYYELELKVKYKHYDDEETKGAEVKVEKILSKFSHKINKIKKIKHEVAIYFNSYLLSEKIAKEFRKYFFCSISKSRKIIGRFHLISKDKYRYFLTIHLLNFKRGDTIIVKGETYKIFHLDRDKLFLKNFKGDKKQFTFKKIEEYYQFLGKIDEDENEEK